MNQLLQIQRIDYAHSSSIAIKTLMYPVFFNYKSVIEVIYSSIVV